MEIIWQGIFNGLVMGWIYVLVALGLTIVFSIMGIVQFAHGEILFRNNRIDAMPGHKIVQLGIVQIPERRRLFPYMRPDYNVRQNP